MKIFEQVIERVEPSEESGGEPWDWESNFTYWRGFRLRTENSECKLFIFCEEFNVGDRLRITVEKVEG